MEKTKLKINTAAGILDIINAILFISSWFIVFTAAVGDAFSGGTGSSAYAAGGFFYIMAAIGLVLHIMGLVKSKKVGISIVGHILGITGCGIFLLAMLFAFPAMVLMILAAIFTLMQKNVEAK